MYKVFYYDRIVLLCSTQIETFGYDFSHKIKLKSIGELMGIIGEFLTNKDFTTLCIEWNDLNELFEEFVNYFRFIQAAGGVVINETNEMLCIYRLDCWDLPKGKMEKGEKPEECAIREVQEETGIIQPEVKKKLESTYHIYFCPHKNKLTLKKTHWYLMYIKGSNNLIPQVEEDITEARWCSKQFVQQKVVSQSYRSLEPLYDFFLSDF